jgi:hypothetical protein
LEEYLNVSKNEAMMIERIDNNSVSSPEHGHRPKRFLRVLGWVALWLVIALLNLWAVAAIYVDCRVPKLGAVIAVLYLVALVLLMVTYRRKRAWVAVAGFCVVLVWWLSLKPSNLRDWRSDVDRVAWTETHGDAITVHNVRDCTYVAETSYSNCWSDRTYRLSQLRGADLFFVNWGIKWIGHPIISFDFGPDGHLAFSIEARYKVGQTYSAILGFFRQYELIIIAADERDVIRLRTNYRKDEEVYLYHTSVPEDVVHKFFMTYVDYVNRLKNEPEWYNAATKNCTTTMSKQLNADRSHSEPWTYKLLVNGELDELIWQRGMIDSGGLPFAELKQREHINDVAHRAGTSDAFSVLIREGRVGF